MHPIPFHPLAHPPPLDSYGDAFVPSGPASTLRPCTLSSFVSIIFFFYSSYFFSYFFFIFFFLFHLLSRAAWRYLATYGSIEWIYPLDALNSHPFRGSEVLDQQTCSRINLVWLFSESRFRVALTDYQLLSSWEGP